MDLPQLGDDFFRLALLTLHVLIVLEAMILNPLAPRDAADVA